MNYADRLGGSAAECGVRVSRGDAASVACSLGKGRAIGCEEANARASTG